MFACLLFCTSISDLDACCCVVHPTCLSVYLQRGDAQLNSIHGVLSLSQPPSPRSLEHCIQMSVFDACCSVVHPTYSCVYRLETSTKIGQIVGPLSARAQHVIEVPPILHQYFRFGCLLLCCASHLPLCLPAKRG